MANIPPLAIEKVVLLIVCAFVGGVLITSVLPWPRSQSVSSSEGNQVVLAGRIVDLRSRLTGSKDGKDAIDGARRCIRRGIPIALETADGLVLVGLSKGNLSRLAEYATELVEARGALYEDRGVRYLEVTAIQRCPAAKLDLAEPRRELQAAARDNDGHEEVSPHQAVAHRYGP